MGASAVTLGAYDIAMTDDSSDKIERVAKAIKEAWAGMGHMPCRSIRMRLWHWLGRQLRPLPAILTLIGRGGQARCGLRLINGDAVVCYNDAPPRGAAVKESRARHSRAKSRLAVKKDR
jgi:hypothetical protein